MAAVEKRKLNIRVVVANYTRIRLESLLDEGIDIYKTPELRHFVTDLDRLREETRVVRIIEAFAKRLNEHSKHRIFVKNFIPTIDMRSPVFKNKYDLIMGRLFAKGKLRTWGAIAAVVVYTSELIYAAIKKGVYHLAFDLINWCVMFFDKKKLDDWVDFNGGWNTPDIHKGRNESNEAHYYAKNEVQRDNVQRWTQPKSDLSAIPSRALPNPPPPIVQQYMPSTTTPAVKYRQFLTGGETNYNRSSWDADYQDFCFAIDKIIGRK